MKKGLSQEALKLIACLTMLIDHIGFAVVYPMYARAHIAGGLEMTQTAQSLYNLYLLLHIIGRLAFPLFAFLLVEGASHTRNRKKYLLRLLFCALISELPFNLMVSDSPKWQYSQSIMVTLALGLVMVLAMERCRSLSWKSLMVLPFALAAELLRADYGWGGIVLIALFALSREMYNPNLIRTFGMLVLFHYMSSTPLQLGNITVPIQAIGALSMLFIASYDGRKLTHSKAVQWGFYLFYPVHMMILWAVHMLLPTGIPL